MTTTMSYRVPEDLHEELALCLMSQDSSIGIAVVYAGGAILRLADGTLVDVRITPSAELARYRRSPEGIFDPCDDDSLYELIESALSENAASALVSVAGSTVYDVSGWDDDVCEWHELEFVAFQVSGETE